MKQENLIFLISQPRSGSTLLQKIIGANKDIYTRSEPWLMLHPAYSLKNSGYVTDYNIELEKRALNDFFSELPNKENFYIDKIREMYLSLYSQYLSKNNKKYFLDKTPRYYLIIDELRKIFPQSKQIILVRNPLAVLSSLIPRKETWYKLYENKYDLLNAVDILENIIVNKLETQYVLRYEEMLTNKKETLESLCKFIGIDFQQSMLTNYLDETENWSFGDQKIYNQASIDQTKSNKWLDGLENPQYWRVMYDYLNMIGSKKYQTLGYDFDKTMKTIIEACPLESVDQVIESTVSLTILLDNLRDQLVEVHNLKKKLESTERNNIALEKEIHKKENIIQEILTSKRWKLISKIVKLKKMLLGK